MSSYIDGVGGQALLLQSDYTNYNYIGSTTAVTASSNTQTFVEKKQAYQFGFMIETFKQFYKTMDWHLNWYHYKNTVSQSLPSGINVWQSSFVGNVLNDMTPTWDAVNLEVANTFTPSNTPLRLRLHGGLQYVYINLNQVTTGTNATAGNTLRRESNSRYQGAGLRVGSDLTYHLPERALAVYINVAGALLTGNQKFNRTATISIPPNFEAGNSGSSTGTVPEFEGKIGFSKTLDVYKTNVLFNLGWMWDMYFNPIQTGDQGQADGRTIVSNFALQGLFFGARWRGDMI